MAKTQSSATHNPAHWVLFLAFVQLFYFVINWTATGPFHTVPEFGIDRWISFNPHWVWIYFSWYVFLIASVSGEDARPSAIGLAHIGMVSYAIYLIYPTIFERPELIHPQGISATLTAWAYSLDQPTNLAPSLHVSTTAFVVMRKSGSKFQAAWLAWGALIVFSCLALKQHLFFDAVSGLALGIIAFAATNAQIRKGTESSLFFSAK